MCDSQLLPLGTRVAWGASFVLDSSDSGWGEGWGGGTAGQTPHQPEGAASVHHQNLKLLS